MGIESIMYSTSGRGSLKNNRTYFVFQQIVMFELVKRRSVCKSVEAGMTLGVEQEDNWESGPLTTEQP